MTHPTRAYQRFFAELKRRRVFNNAALYGGVAFVVFQAADFVLPALRLPEWVSTLIVVLAVLGFFPAMVLAWFFDVTSEGLKRTTPPKTGELEAIVALSPRRRWPMGLAAAGGISLLFFATALELRSLRGPEPPALPPEIAGGASVVLLPFLNLLGDGEDYFSEGVSNELLEALRKIRGLRATARAPVGNMDWTSWGQVPTSRGSMTTFVLEGTIGEAGAGVELTVRLVQEGGDGTRWVRTYRLPPDKFLAALDSVAWEVAGRIGVEIPSGRRAVLVGPRTEDFRAYRDYLRGRYLERSQEPKRLESAVEYYHKALLLDPDFQAARSALATAYVLLPERDGIPVVEILPYVQAALEGALEPGKETAEGYAASGYFMWLYLWDFRGAEGAFRKAIQMDPVNPLPRQWYAEFLATQRRWDEGLEQVEKALELDPLSAPAYLTRGVLLRCAGREGAARSFRRALELAPDLHPAAFLLGSQLAMEGDLEGAAAAFDRFSSLTGSDPEMLRTYLSALSNPSQGSEVAAVLDEAGSPGPVQGAGLLASLGETDKAISLLRRAARERSPDLPWVNAMPEFEGIRGDPRFQGLLTWMTPESTAN